MQPAEAARRVKRFEATPDPRTLWPGVAEGQFAAAMREIVRVTSSLLSPASSPVEFRSPVPGGPLALGVAAFASGLGPLLGYWIEAGRLRAPAELAEVLFSHLDHGRRRAGRLRAELERIVTAFAAEEIDVTVLKGMHTGWVYFPEPGTRPASDIDILVHPDRAADARHLLEAAGFRQAHGMSQRTTWEPPGSPPPASVYLTHADNPWTLDLHATLDRRFPSAGAGARFDLRADEDLAEWHTGDMRVRVLSQPLLSNFLAVHATYHFPYVSALRLVELVLVLQRDGGSAFAWDSLAERLEATNASGFGYPALKLAADLLPGVVDASLLARLRHATPPRVRSLAERLTPDTALQMFRRSVEGRFLWAGSGWRRLRSYLRWLWPRDSDGGRMPLPDAIRITGLRLRRLAMGLLSWRHR
jgi:hypothetical protein